jgi:peptidoglycan/LPS O-acetylase OafA/YrhL
MVVTMVIAAAISYYAVERPILRLKDRDLQAWLRRRGTVRSNR